MTTIHYLQSGLSDCQEAGVTFSFMPSFFADLVWKALASALWRPPANPLNPGGADYILSTIYDSEFLA